MSIHQDRGGVLWVGTQGGGLNRWNTVTSSFSLFRVDARAPSTFSSNAVTSFESEPGVVWIGTYQGLNRYDRKSGAIRSYRHDPRDRHSLSDDRVMSLQVDRRGALWVGTLDGGLNRLDPASGRFTHLRHDPEDEDALSGDGVTSLVEDADGSLWVGIYRGGLNRVDPATGTVIRRFRHDPANPGSLSSDRVIALFRDSKGALWVGTEGGGLNRLDRASGTFLRYQRDPKQAGSLGGDVVFTIHEDRRGTLWVGTQGGGLSRADPEDRGDGRLRFRTYTERNGLPNDSVYGILEDHSGDLWLSTNRGLSRLDPRRETFRNFDTSHGLQSNEFNFGAYHRAVTGEMFVGGNAGFNAFVPDRVRVNENVPPLALTSLRKLGHEVNAQEELARFGAIRLGHRDYVVSFEFAALDYSAPERNRYAYKLDGLDREWIHVGSARRASYTNLSPGRYVFRVKGSNSDGTWNEEGLAVAVDVLPPPWRTWWAYAAYALVLAAAVRAYARLHARRLEREAEYSRRLEREVQERTAELALRNDELHEANRKLEEASLTDSLTGLANRRFLMAHIRREVALVDRYYRRLAAGTARPGESRPDFALMMIDLDGLKGVNDTYGHAAGDQVLVQMRDVLDRACRKSDTILRWGGDEFLVVARQADHDVAEMLAERVRRAVEEHGFDLGGHRPVHLGCSIGWAIYPFVAGAPGLLTWEQVGTIADRALYAAKSSGRNAWVGILSTAATPMADTVHLINQRPGALVREGSIEVRTSLAAASDLVWERRVEARGGEGSLADQRSGAASDTALDAPALAEA
jgi:diguanylate cyclase (GGDEF)-like protein